jgi:hypothetical protein
VAGTNGAAASANSPHTSQAGGYPAAAISAPKSGGPAAAVSRWVVFWVPRARPLQNGPANSVMAVDSSPLSSTASTDAVTMTATASDDPK